MKKYLLPILTTALCLTATSAFAQKKGLVKGLTEALSSKATSAVSAQVERQVARATLGAHTIPYASAASIPTATAVLSLERVKAEALHPQTDISKLVPVRLTDRADLVNSSLLRVQKIIQQDGKIPTSYRGHIPDVKVTWLAYHRLLLEDRKGNLSPEEQIQLRSLFWHTNTSISSVGRKLQSWQDIYGADPILPDQKTLDYLSGVNKPPYGNAFEEWTLAADIYMLQKLYGTNLPKRIRNAQVLPLKERQQLEAQDSFQQLLKREQETIEKDRANGLFDYYWSKVEIADVVYKDTDKLARMVKAFYFYYIDPQLKVFPRAKYLKTNEEGKIYEIPLKKGLFLEVPGPLNLIPITPEEYVVFKADGEYENPHLVKRADVEFLTDLASYKNK